MSIVLEQEREELTEMGPNAPTQARLVWRRLARNPLAVVSMVVLSVILLASTFYPAADIDQTLAIPHKVITLHLPRKKVVRWIVPHKTLLHVRLHYPGFSRYRYDVYTNDVLQGASRRHPLGTDDVGYDTLTRLAVGGRISLFVGVGVEAIVVLVGVTVGLVAGYKGGWRDNVLMRVTDMTFAFPDILLAILIMAVRGASLLNIFVALGITGWPGLARVVRGQAMALRNREFVDAARAIGVPDAQIMRRHLLPNLLSPIIVFCTIDIAGVIIAEATLSFLGIGVQPPMPSWGSLISNARASGYWQSAPELVIYPALCLSLTVLSLNFLGDALRDALDPRSL